MDPALVVHLMIVLSLAGEHPTLFVDDKVSSIEVCLVRAEVALRRFAKVRAEDGWEVSVRCNIEKPEEHGG